MHIEGLEKVINFRQKNPIDLAWGNFIQGYLLTNAKSHSQVLYVMVDSAMTTQLSGIHRTTLASLQTWNCGFHNATEGI